MKLKRGQKLCKNCQAVNAARQRKCVDCGKAFQLKNTPIKNEIKDWKSLQKGDTFRIINGTGSYYLLKRDCGEGEKGEKLFIGPKGKYQVKKIDMENNGIHAWSLASPGNSHYEFVYMGQDRFFKEVDIHRRAPRIIKFKYKSKYKKNS